MMAQRDLRIDFFRGLALLIVVVDHVEGWAERPVVETWTLISLGFSDAAEIFVFLSGYVFAVAYSRTLERAGFSACFAKAVKRSAQIYLAYLLAALTVIAIGALCIQWNPPKFDDHLRMGERVGGSIVAALTLRFHPWGFDILAMYVPILPAMAVLLYLRRKEPWLAWAISGGAYLAVQLNPGLNLHRFADGNLWYFNPLAWQFLFFLGMALGDPDRRRIQWVPRALMIVVSIAMLLFGLFVLKVSLHLIRWNLFAFEDLLPIYRFYWSWGDKTTLAPLRIAHFFALAYLTSLVLPRRLSFWSGRLARPIVVAGQHSLEVYAWGLVLSFVGAFLITAGFASIFDVLLLDLAACVASIGFACLLHAWKQRRSALPDASASGPPAPHVPPKTKPGRTAKPRRRRAAKSRRQRQKPNHNKPL